jgi:predicted site-specific integrase-resolvase
MSEDELIRLSKASAELGIPKRTLNRWARNRQIKVIILPSGQYRVRRSTLVEIFKESEAGADHET